MIGLAKVAGLDQISRVLAAESRAKVKRADPNGWFNGSPEEMMEFANDIKRGKKDINKKFRESGMTTREFGDFIRPQMENITGGPGDNWADEFPEHFPARDFIGKKANDNVNGLARIAASDEGDFVDDPKWVELNNANEEAEQKMDEIRNQFSPNYLDRGNTALATGLIGGAGIGTLAGGALGSHAITDGLKPKSIPGKIGVGLAGLAGGTFGAMAGLPIGAAVGGLLTQPIQNHYMKKTEKANPELWNEFQSARRVSSEAEDALMDYEFENYYN